jgi:hypothetical protein
MRRMEVQCGPFFRIQVSISVRFLRATVRGHRRKCLRNTAERERPACQLTQHAKLSTHVHFRSEIFFLYCIPDTYRIRVLGSVCQWTALEAAFISGMAHWSGPNPAVRSRFMTATCSGSCTLSEHGLDSDRIRICATERRLTLSLTFYVGIL